MSPVGATYVLELMVENVRSLTLKFSESSGLKSKTLKNFQMNKLVIKIFHPV